MTNRGSLLAGFTYPSTSMSMPRRHSWRSRSHGYAAMLHLLTHLLLLAVSLIPLSLLLGLLSDMQDPVIKPPTTGTRQQLRQHPFQLLPIIRLRSSKKWRSLSTSDGNGRDSSSAPCLLLHRSSNHTFYSAFSPCYRLLSEVALFLCKPSSALLSCFHEETLDVGRSRGILQGGEFTSRQYNEQRGAELHQKHHWKQRGMDWVPEEKWMAVEWRVR